MPSRYKHIIEEQSNNLAGFDKGEYGLASNHYFTALYEAAVKLDVDIKLLLQGIGLPKSGINQPSFSIPTEKLAILQKVIWDWLNDESMGANSRPIPSGTYYMMGRLTVQEPTLEKALRLGAKFYNLMFQREFVTLSLENDLAVLAVEIDAPDYKHLFSEISLLAWHRYASWLISDILPLHETRFPYSPPSNAGEYNYLFPGVHKFLNKKLAIVFPKQYLERETKQSISSLKVFMNRCPLELFKQYAADYSLTSELKILVKKGLDSGLVTLEHCSAELHMTTRTLMRKLKSEGTSFQQVKDLVRRDRAIFLLVQKGVAINEVAERVGYSDPAVFTRAFRNWTGDTPREFRSKLSAR